MSCNSGAEIWVAVETFDVRDKYVEEFDIDTEESCENQIAEASWYDSKFNGLDYPIIHGNQDSAPYYGFRITSVEWCYTTLDMVKLEMEFNECKELLVELLDIDEKDVKLFINSSYF